MCSLCIIIPFFDHGLQFEKMVPKLIKHGLSIIVVDDGSSPEDKEILRKVELRFPQLQVFHLSKNSGKGGAVYRAVTEAHRQGYSHVLQIDADGQHEISDIPKMVKISAENPSSVILGTPQYDASVPKIRFIGRYITSFWIWFETLSFQIKDAMCGFRVYPVAPALKILDNVYVGKRMDFDPEIAVRLYWLGCPVINFPTPVCYDSGGRSHFNLVSDNARMFPLHFRLFWGFIFRLPMLLRMKFSSPAKKKTQHWAELPERTNVFGIRLMLLIYNKLGRRIFEFCLHPVVLYFFLSDGDKRRYSKEYLQAASQSGAPVSMTWKSRYRHFYEYGKSILDKFASWSGHLDERQVRWNDRLECTKLLKSKGGGVLITSHLGNIEVLRALAEYISEIPINVLVYTKHAQKINRLLKSINPKVDIKLVEVDNVSPAMALQLKEMVDRGEMVAIMGDRVSAFSEKRSIEAAFLGKRAAFPQGPFILAGLLQCPIYLLFCLKNEKNVYDVYFETLREKLNISRKSRDTELSSVISDYAERLAYYCCKTPYQWFNYFDFWRKVS